MIILKAIFILIMVVIIAIIINGVEDYCDKRGVSMSFRESMDLTELPVVTFYSSGTKLNFLLDTGSNNSIINKSILESVQYSKLDYEMTTFGMEGNKIVNNVYSIPIEYKGQKYDGEFTAIDMSDAFGHIKKESGVTIHGVLGSLFFKKYQYVLDFDKLIAYSK